MGAAKLECAEKTGVPKFGFLWQAKTGRCGDEHGFRRGRAEPGAEPGGLKEGDWVYTGRVPGAKMEILDDTPPFRSKYALSAIRAHDSLSGVRHLLPIRRIVASSR
jgi:hypothetical protein